MACWNSCRCPFAPHATARVAELYWHNGAARTCASGRVHAPPTTPPQRGRIGSGVDQQKQRRDDDLIAGPQSGWIDQRDQVVLDESAGITDFVAVAAQLAYPVRERAVVVRQLFPEDIYHLVDVQSVIEQAIPN